MDERISFFLRALWNQELWQALKGDLYMMLKNMDTDKATKILAKSLYRQLIRNGFTNNDIINLSKEILDYMAQEMRKEVTSKDSNKKDRLLIGWLFLCQAELNIPVKNYYHIR